MAEIEDPKKQIQPSITFQEDIDNRDHMTYLEEIALKDVAILQEKEHSYKGSWKKRGGVGAFMMLARKWDRIEVAVAKPDIATGNKYNVLNCLMEEDDPTGLLDDIQDLRRYLILVEAEMRAQQYGK